jgi:hypothetical protein
MTGGVLGGVGTQPRRRPRTMDKHGDKPRHVVSQVWRLRSVDEYQIYDGDYLSRPGDGRELIMENLQKWMRQLRI